MTTDGSIEPEHAVLRRRDGDCAYITLNRPHRLNAVSEALYRELIAALDEVNDSDARVVVLEGAGRAFSAGADLKAHAAGRRSDEQEAYVRLGTEACLKLGAIAQPVIAAVHGYAIGAGAELAISCDVIIAAHDARLAFPEASLATYVGGGVTAILPRLIGRARATELLMFGRRINGEDAVSLGLAMAAVHPDELKTYVHSAAEELAEKGPLAIRQLKRHLRGPDRQATDAAREEEATLIRLMQTADWREGVAASREHRAARYVGR
jgi:enoyl-CoA hydratase/carnithine racemase